METEVLFLFTLVAVLLALAGYYGWRQMQSLRRLQTSNEMAIEERHFVQRMAYRRLTASGLMIVAAGLLAGSFWLNATAKEIGDKKEAAQAENRDVPPNDEDRRFLNLYALYWIAFLLVLLAILFLAGIDLFATRRFGLDQHRKIQADRRSMIEEEVLRLRQDRNGHAS
ncbi:MAG: hypothetical protein ACJ8FY_00910 [Gemmataceae bacterium]